MAYKARVRTSRVVVKRDADTEVLQADRHSKLNERHVLRHDHRTCWSVGAAVSSETFVDRQRMIGYVRKHLAVYFPAVHHLRHSARQSPASTETRFDVTISVNNKKGKVFPYSLPSVGPGADPGVQAVSPQVT